jgi:glycosyltransferase involved in cell wall biosynthesis
MAASSPAPRLLALEPYYGGSHRAFLEGLARHLPFAWDRFTLPARNWKWRMRLAAAHFADLLSRAEPVESYEAVLCSGFVDVAALRGLGPAWLRRAPVLTYFHENQFAYPVQSENERDVHFGLTNLTTALASDRLAFNSRHNLETFLEGSEELLKQGCDLAFPKLRDRITAKARVLPPGLEFDDIDAEPRQPSTGSPVIVWNHRWEHDKDPQTFFETLLALDRAGIEFRLIILGQTFRQVPPIFAEAAARLGERLLHSGYCRSRRDYVRWLRQGDLVVSTARHEFFGLAVLEAVRAGCRPLLPARLSYPELFPGEFLYEEGELFATLKRKLMAFRPFPSDQARELTERFSWSALASLYRKWLLAET